MKKEIKVVHFGDSFTECPGVDEGKRWVDLYSKKLRKEFKETCEFSILNKGVSGNNTRLGLERMQKDVQHEYPDILTIQFGIIDCTYWQSNKGVPIVSKMAYKANLIEMVDRARVFDVKEIIFQTNHHILREQKELNDKTYNQNLDEYNELLVEVASEKGCELFDIKGYMSVHNPLDYIQPMPDGIHLNEFGCKLYFDYLYPRYKRVMEKIIN